MSNEWVEIEGEDASFMGALVFVSVGFSSERVFSVRVKDHKNNCYYRQDYAMKPHNSEEEAEWARNLLNEFRSREKRRIMDNTDNSKLVESLLGFFYAIQFLANTIDADKTNVNEIKDKLMMLINNHLERVKRTTDNKDAHDIASK